MVGQYTAALEPAPRRWIQRVWGVPNIHIRQKWGAVWPTLSRLPQSGQRVIDAGCGDGRWTLELAARRPRWHLVGIDRDEASISRAQKRLEALGLTNVEFVTADFRDARLPASSDVVLSIASAHYASSKEERLAIFRAFRGWLKPGGMLCLLGPRRSDGGPFDARLPHPEWHEVFSSEDLAALCRDAGLEIDQLHGCIGRPGILAKQLAWVSDGGPPLVRALLYPVQYLMATADRWITRARPGLTLMWLLLARTRLGGSHECRAAR
jgi:SAM-dependent methyltransferase